MRHKIGPEVHFKLPQLYDNAVLLLALEAHVTKSEYLRQIVEEHLKAKTRERIGLRFDSIVAQLSRHVKEYIDLVLNVPIAAELPSQKLREELEALVSKVLQDAQNLLKTEEAAKNIQSKVAVMAVVAALANAHIAIIKDPDQTVVAQLVERFEAALRGLEKEGRKDSAQPGPD